MLTFESASDLGVNAIVEKLAGLPFQKVKHAVSTLDAQPTVQDGVLVLVTGQLLVRLSLVTSGHVAFMRTLLV